MESQQIFKIEIKIINSYELRTHIVYLDTYKLHTLSASIW